MPAFSPSHSLIWSISGVGNQCQHGKTPNPFKPCFLRRLPLGLALVQARAQGFASNRAQVEKKPRGRASICAKRRCACHCEAPIYCKAHPSNAGRSHRSRHVCWSIACHARRVKWTHCGNHMNMRFVARRNCLFTSASLLTSFLLPGFVTTGIKFGMDAPPTNWSTRTQRQAGSQPTSLRLTKSLEGELSFARFTSCIDVWGWQFA